MNKKESQTLYGNNVDDIFQVPHHTSLHVVHLQHTHKNAAKTSTHHIFYYIWASLVRCSLGISWEIHFTTTARIMKKILFLLLFFSFAYKILEKKKRNVSIHGVCIHNLGKRLQKEREKEKEREGRKIWKRYFCSFTVKCNVCLSNFLHKSTFKLLPFVTLAHEVR